MDALSGRDFDVTGEWDTVGVLRDNVFAFAYLSFRDVVAPIGAAAHHVGEGRFLIMSTGRVCAFFATVISVTVGPAVLQGTRGRRLGTSAALTGAVSASASAAVSASII